MGEKMDGNSNGEVIRLDTAKMIKLSEKRVAKPTQPGQKSFQSEATVTPINSHEKYEADPYFLIKRTLPDTIRPTVFKWLQQIRDTLGDPTGNTVAKETANYLREHPDATLSEIYTVIWGRE